MLRALVVSALLMVSCKSSESEPPAGGDNHPGRVPVVHKDHALYNRLEGTAYANACDTDSQCFKAGCSAEICAATKDIMGTCEALPVQFPADASCGCVSGQCTWWNGGKEKLRPEPQVQVPEEQPQGARCGESTCGAGETCIEYYGVAGPRGPKFQTCGIRCGEGGKCPGGKRCVTIADGPGPVCQ